MSKYRIIWCDSLSKTWFEVERKGWFGWYTENYMIAGVLLWAEAPIEFKTYEDAKKYITAKLPKPKAKDLPVKRQVYETFN